MASLLFPDTGTRLVILPTGLPAVGAVGYLYANAALTVVAEAYHDANGVKGALLPLDADGRRYITLDAYGEQPDYWGPDAGADRLWIVINGVASAVDADYNARIDMVVARITAVESGGGGADDGLLLHKATAETITDVKTFTVSPIVPTPTANTQAANKGYADTGDALLTPLARSIATTAPLTGGGDLSADRTLAVSGATTGAVGVVQLAGDLAGTAVAPVIATGAVTSAKIADGAIVDGDVSSSAALSTAKLASPVSATKTSNYTITSVDGLVVVNAVSGAFNVTLPTAVGAAGKHYTIKRLDGSVHLITVNTTSAQTIDGASVYHLYGQGSTIEVVSDNARWLVVPTAARTGVINVKDRGALGLGATSSASDTTIIQSVIDSVPSGTGMTIYFPPGTYDVDADTAPWSVSGKKNITFVGDMFARPGGTTIRYTGSTAPSVIVGVAAEGIAFRGLSFTPTNAAWAGRFFDFRGGQAFHIAIEECFFGGTGDLWTAICSGQGYNHTYARNYFYRCGIAIEGSDVTTLNTVQSATVSESHFSSLVATAHITNPGAGWMIHGNSVEPLSSGDAGFVKLTGTNDMRDLSITGNWCGDITTGGGVHVQVKGTGIYIAHNLFGASATTKAIQAVGDTDGFAMIANRVSGPAAALVDWGAYSHKRPAVLANTEVTGGALFLGTVPPTLVYQDTGSTIGLNLGTTAIRNTAQVRYLDAAGTGFASVQMDSTGVLVTDSIPNNNLNFRLLGAGSFQAFRVQGFNGSTYDTLLNLRRTQLEMSIDVATTVAGKGFRAKEGANAKQGVATLVAGTVTVANTSITATSRIFLTTQSLGTVTDPKSMAVTARSVGVSFTITSGDNTDTSVVAYEIFEPAA